MFDRKNCQCPPEAAWKCRACEKVNRHLHDLRLRILKTLEAHLTWIERANEVGNPDAPHRWITGKEIKAGQTHDWLPPASLTDTPFEIIKTYNLHQFYTENKGVVNSIKYDERDHLEIMNDLQERSVLVKRLETSIRPWLKKLYESDKRCQYAFPRPQKDRCRKDGIKKYHLGEHVWICRAIKCVEALGLNRFLEHPQLHENETGVSGPNQREKGEETPSEGSEKQDQSDWSEREREPDNTDQPQGQEPAKKVPRYQAEELQRAVLKRFTTRNPQTQQRMLATCRTQSESRFLFHAKDTALFYAMDDGFFDREMKRSNRRSNWPNKIAVWRETVEVQADHEETQTLEWENPLYYALALIISSRRKRINKLSPDEMLDASANILFALSSSGGLFPGHLNEKREPVAFEDEPERDKYWHATFEIPYILWKYGKSHLETSLELEKADFSGKLQQVMLHVKSNSQLRQPMPKTMEFATFNSLVDKSRLVEVSDDWLRDMPSFLNFDSTTDFQYLDFYRSKRLTEDWDFGGVINAALESEDHGSSSEPKGTVYDVQKNISGQNTSPSAQELLMPLQTNDQIRDILKITRSAQKAKKRLIWLPRADKKTALTCYLASQHMERDNLSAFFDKHASYDKHFFDGTSAALNEWVTELHLSYFRREAWNSQDNQTTGTKQSAIPNESFILVDPPTGTKHHLSKDTDGTKIVRSVMSFRLVGDFFDRYWTCHFLECDPVKARIEGNSQGLKPLGLRLSYLGSKSVTEMKGSAREKQPWQQRKVLELLLLDYVLTEICASTGELLDWVRGNVLEKKNDSLDDEEKVVSLLHIPFKVQATEPLSPLAKALQVGVQSPIGSGSDGYFSIVDRCRLFEQILQAMEEELSGNLETLSFWNSREKDREPERPRWTRNDEMTYRQVINKLQVMNQRNIRDLDGLRATIRTFRESLLGKMDTMRSDLEYRGSENINLFTYVTVVFLPLGFATGIFSMSDTPKHSVLVNMIKLSLVAMAITLFFLANAKTTGKTIVQPIIMICRFINDTFLHPLLTPFCVVGNFLLLVGIAIHFIFSVFFHALVRLPLTELVNRCCSLDTYQGVVELNRQVIGGRMDLGAKKLGQELYNDLRPPKSKDPERGEAGPTRSENEATGTQP